MGKLWLFHLILHGKLRFPFLRKGHSASPSEKACPFDSRFMRSYRTRGLHGERILVVENDIVLSTPNQVARFRVMGNLDEIRKQFGELWLTMRWYLLSFGIAGILINIIVIALGLHPLVCARRVLEAIRAGSADQVDTRLLREIVPLADEMNALIDNNRRIVECFRTQVGNLAHSLKTPLAY